jgi:truncated hemoglobin YjbI
VDTAAIYDELNELRRDFPQWGIACLPNTPRDKWLATWVRASDRIEIERDTAAQLRARLAWFEEHMKAEP